MSKKRWLVLGCWVVLGCFVAAGSLLPAGSPVLAAAGSLAVSDKAMHFVAYLGLAVLPVIGFADRRRGLVAGLGMFGLGVVLEMGQMLAPGRSWEVLDLVANGMGVGCGVLLGRGWGFVRFGTG